MLKVIVATGNQGKLSEIREILGNCNLELSSLKDHFRSLPQIPETGSTFLENARIKADWVFEKTGIWSLADDSGLEVDALNGAPGVWSARFAGEECNSNENNQKLLKLLGDFPFEARTARFRCVIVLKTGTDSYLSTEGVCEGKIGFAPKGSEGFGYDPLFYPGGYDRTFAQLDSVEKNAISHRGKALIKLRETLNDICKSELSFHD